MKHTLRWSILAAALAAVVMTGCKEGGPGRQSHVTKTGEPLIRVAIIPFDSIGLNQENAARIVTEEILTTLMSTGMFDVVEPGMVYMAMAEAGTRNAWGVDPLTMQRIQESIGPVRAFIVGTVQEFGEVRVGSVSYPSISVAARVLEPQSGRILWAGSASRTGAESEKLFGMGAVHSSGRLARAVVRQLMMDVDQEALLASLRAAPSAPVTPLAPVTPAAPTGPTGDEQFMDEAANVTEAIMRDYAPDIEGLTKGEVTYRVHQFPIVETNYQAGGLLISVKLEDTRKKDTALARLRHEFPGETEGKFAGLPAFMGPSPSNMPGAFHLGIAAGRFVVFVRGPEGKKADIENVATGILAAMK